MGQANRVVGAASPLFKQIMQPSRYKALYGGRGSAKSHFFAEAMVANAASSKGFRAVCVREVQKSLKESAKRLIEDKIAHLGVSDRFEVLTDSIRTPGNGVIIFQGMQDHTAESIKSLEGFHVAWCEEAQSLSSKSLEMLRPTIRTPHSELWFSWNPRSASDPVDLFFRGLNPPDNALILRINYDQNEMFPDELETERRHDEKFNRDRYGHIWEGDYEPQAIGAIWSRAILHRNRKTLEEVKRVTTIKRIVVAVDHAVSDGPNSDIHGIVAVALGEDGRAYVLEDASTQGTPRQWADRAISTYDKWDADCIVIERNQGGDLVKNNLMTVRDNIRIVEVHATRGKHVRAEPISAIYEQDQVSHVGTFTELEDQMCLITTAGYEGSGSPDRADALVWAMTELFPQLTVKDNWGEAIKYPENMMSIA